MCPVRRAIFPDSRMKWRQIVTLEKEFAYPQRSDTCHLYFFRRGLMGYAWIVPKGNGFVNIGLGGKSRYFKDKGEKIHDHFRAFLADLVTDGELDAATAADLQETGHPYFLYSYKGDVKRDNCFLIGDSAGLASIDLGEGIGPAVESALMTAREILGTGIYRKQDITMFSFGGMVGRLMRRISDRHLAPAGT
jgi:flavin-dependent dehydrogenase